MKIVKSSVDVIEQGPGIEGMLKHIERVGKISHKAEGNITETSYIRFIEVMKNCGHFACFDMGTVYLKMPIWKVYTIGRLLTKHPWTKICVHGFYAYITTTYRIIVQLGLEPEMTMYWSEPGKYHYYRATSHWICSRTVSHQIVRHASLRPLQESQRYCNYSKVDKFDGQVQIILPQWAYDVKAELLETHPELEPLDGEELWSKLILFNETAARRYASWKNCEDEYMWEVTNTESTKLRAEDARGILPNDAKTELYLVGYLEDWYKKPITKEKTGFFYLRSDYAAQRDVRVLSKDLEEQFMARGYNNMK